MAPKGKKCARDTFIGEIYNFRNLIIGQIPVDGERSFRDIFLQMEHDNPEMGSSGSDKELSRVKLPLLKQSLIIYGLMKICDLKT